MKTYKILRQGDADERDMSLEEAVNELAALGWVVVAAVNSDANGCRIILEKDAP